MASRPAPLSSLSLGGVDGRLNASDFMGRMATVDGQTPRGIEMAMSLEVLHISMNEFAIILAACPHAWPFLEMHHNEYGIDGLISFGNYVILLLF